MYNEYNTKLSNEMWKSFSKHTGSLIVFTIYGSQGNSCGRKKNSCVFELYLAEVFRLVRNFKTRPTLWLRIYQYITLTYLFISVT